jgi:signal transduction histidine kinase
VRGSLAKVSLAVTVMVALAFLVPLGLVVRELARDRAFTDAERQAAALQPALIITTDRAALEPALAGVRSGAQGRLAVHLPDGSVLGHPRAAAHDLDAARGNARASRVRTAGGWSLLQPVALDAGRITVVEVYVPEDDTSRGVTTAWLVLTGVALALVGGSVLVADRLGAQVVRSAKGLAAAAGRLGGGDLRVRITPEGPSELKEAAVSFNTMADRVSQLLANERELAADLSHRLRTPLTVLRLNAASLAEDDAGMAVRHAVAQLEREVDEIIRTAKARDTSSTEAIGCDAAEVLRDRVGFWSALAEDQDRDCHLTGADNPVFVPVPRGELTAAIDAMVGNVFRHTEEGTAFAVTLHPGHNSAILLVADAGPGIADTEGALRRGRGSGGEGSTGLGLDIVRKLAESTGGEVRIERSVLGGAQVSVRIGDGVEEPVRRRRGRRERRGLRHRT